MTHKRSNTLHQGKYLSLVERDGWEYATRHAATAVVMIVAVRESGEVLLVEQHRPPVEQTMVELPAGLAGDLAGSEDESLLDAAQRELLEETGYVAERWTRLFTGYASPGLTDEKTTCFLAEHLTRQTSGGGDATEAITVHEVPLGQVWSWLAKRGETLDIKLLAGLQAAGEVMKSRSETRNS